MPSKRLYPVGWYRTCGQLDLKTEKGIKFEGDAVLLARVLPERPWQVTFEQICAMTAPILENEQSRYPKGWGMMALLNLMELSARVGIDEAFKLKYHPDQLAQALEHYRSQA